MLDPAYLSTIYGSLAKAWPVIANGSDSALYLTLMALDLHEAFLARKRRRPCLTRLASAAVHGLLAVFKVL